MRRRQILNINRRFDRNGASTSGGIVVDGICRETRAESGPTIFLSNFPSSIPGAWEIRPKRRAKPGPGLMKSRDPNATIMALQVLLLQVADMSNTTVVHQTLLKKFHFSSNSTFECIRCLQRFVF
jgi:hypothetical protein